MGNYKMLQIYSSLKLLFVATVNPISLLTSFLNHTTFLFSPFSMLFSLCLPSFPHPLLSISACSITSIYPKHARCNDFHTVSNKDSSKKNKKQISSHHASICPTNPCQSQNSSCYLAIEQQGRTDCLLKANENICVKRLRLSAAPQGHGDLSQSGNESFC